ncbi:urease accessory protein UreF [Helicobacter burdigaliensis]|uniref:urease accessory protein UreF n=1 Tax=Helicobacter burdigaliensis TaxID=2315334 RepID=UPI0018E5A8F7|nr:urease accessory UreF family protein [Helicobacter burdigaliensis]
MLGQFLFDSAFANGAYSHSFGLETYISWGKVKDSKSFQEWLSLYMLEVFALQEGVVYILANALKSKPLSLLKLARIANASIMSEENRKGAISIARATLKNTEFLHNDLSHWYYQICQNEDYVHPAIAFSVLSPEDLIEQYVYASIKTLTQNATRAIPLSYKKSSQILYENLELAREVRQKCYLLAEQVLQKKNINLSVLEDLFVSHQEIDLATFAHEKLDFRLFMS